MRRSCRGADAPAPIDLEVTIEDAATEDVATATDLASARDRCRNDNAGSRWPSRDRSSQLPHAERIKAAGCPQ